jgi:hypothetical protein
VSFTVPDGVDFTLIDSRDNAIEPLSASEGVYSFTLLAGKTYEYTATAEGYNGTTREFVATEGLSIDIALTASSYGVGDGFYIYGSANAGKTSQITSGVPTGSEKEQQAPSRL